MTAHPPIAANPRTLPPSQGGGHAVVLGGGVAGLLAARVLSNHFGTVTLVERDLPQPPFPITLTGENLAMIEQALALSDSLEEQRRLAWGGHLTGLARRFQSRLADTVSRSWWKAGQMDVRGANSATQVLAWYLGRLARLAPQDTQVFRALLEADVAASPASALLTPALVRKLVQARRRGVPSRVPSQVNQ